MLLEFIKSDLYRYAGNTKLKSFFKYYTISPGFKYMFYFRICQRLKGKNKLIYLLFRMILRHYSFKFGFDIPVGVNIGYGFYIGHFGGVVISGKAKIGNNVNISQGVTIGYSARGNNAGYPVIKDNVFIGPGAKIVGNIVLEDNVAVGANAVVTKSFSVDEIAAGIPARVISKNGSRGYILNSWNIRHT